MHWYTPRKNQGQIVTVSYSYGHGFAYEMRHDASDNSRAFRRGEIDWSREPLGVDEERVPSVLSWEPCEEPSD